MRATICPSAIILTNARRSMVSIMYERCIGASEVFLIFTTQVYAPLRRLKCYIVKG